MSKIYKATLCCLLVAGLVLGAAACGGGGGSGGANTPSELVGTWQLIKTNTGNQLIGSLMVLNSNGSGKYYFTWGASQAFNWSGTHNGITLKITDITMHGIITWQTAIEIRIDFAGGGYEVYVKM